MTKAEQLDKLRKKVGYCNGRRKVLAMAELAEFMGNVNPAEGLTIALDAVARARELLEKIPKDSDKHAEYAGALAYALGAQVACLQHQLETGEVVALLTEAAAILEGIGDWKKLFAVFVDLAESYRQYSRWPQAMEVVERALVLAESLKMPEQRCRLHAFRASVYAHVEDREAADADIAKSLALLQFCRDKLGIAEAYGALGLYFYLERSYDRAIEYYEKVIAPATAANDHDFLTNVYWQLYYCYLRSEQRDKTASVLLKGFRHAQEGGLAWMEAAFAHELGSHDLFMGNFAGALKYWHRCEELFEQLGDYHNQIFTIVHTGCAHMDFDDSERGRAILRRALKLMPQYEAHPLSVSALDRLLLFDFWEREELESMIALAREAKLLSDRFAGYDFLTNICLVLGAAHIQLGQFAEAEAALNEGLTEARHRKVDYLTVRVLLVRAALGLAKEMPEEALGFAREAEDLFNQDVNSINYTRIIEMLLNIHVARSDYPQAFEYQRKLREAEKLRLTRRNHDIVAGSIQEIEFQRLRQERNEAQRALEKMRNELEKLQKSGQEQALQLEHLKNQAREWREQLRSGPENELSGPNDDRQKLLKSISTALSENIVEQIDADLSGEEDFTRRLGKEYPALSQTERKVCALIKSGKGSKDICRILNISPRTIDTYRYRIRRKMKLDADTDLNLFVMNI